jgi:16S rRNA (adenine1518-N6/adenine1519-N6)-dimethyltransferase
MTKLGQNFLVDNNIVEKEIKYADIGKSDVVLEIGAGKGILTKSLARKANYVIAVEIDPLLYKNLRQELPENVLLIHNDILKVDFNKLPSFNKIVSNLPFQISSSVTFQLLKFGFSKAVLIYQKDFASRMVAVAGSKQYCRLSVSIYYKCFCRVLCTVSRNCFSPVPRVDSSIVEIIPREKPAFNVIDEQFFFNFVTVLFMHRRKTIKNSLASLYGAISDVPFLSNRVEELTPEQIGNLSNIIYNKYGDFQK